VGYTTTHTGTILITGTVPNASVTITTLTTVVTHNGTSSTTTPNATYTASATITSDGVINVPYGSIVGLTQETLTGAFLNNLQGNGTVTMDPPVAGDTNQIAWTAQLGETNVPFTVAGVQGLITIAGTQVTFTVGGASATAPLDPNSGQVSSSLSPNLLGYASVVGTFTSNTSGTGTFYSSSKRSNDSWSTNTGNK
jgi:hypothetical protein